MLKNKTIFFQIQKLGSAINEEQKNRNHRECLSLSLQFQRALAETMDRPHQFYVMAVR